MGISLTLAIYLISVVLVTTLLVSRGGYSLSSAIIISLTLGYIFTWIAHPPHNIDPNDDPDSFMALYYSIHVLTPLILIIYSVYMALNDKGR
jgi:hypothetical protein